MAKVGVIFGGRSVEHDVSVVTAHQVMAVLSDRHDVVPVYVTKDGRWRAGDELNDLALYRDGDPSGAGAEAFIVPDPAIGGLVTLGGRLKASSRIPVDVVVPAIHGTYGEDGTLQGLLELAGLPYVGSGVGGSAAGMDKAMMKALFRHEGLPVVDHTEVSALEMKADPGSAADQVEATIGYPAFVKPARLGSSVGIAKATDRTALLDALDVAIRYDDKVLVEKALEGCVEVNCSVLGGGSRAARASVCEQPVAWQEFLTFSDKYMRGGKGATSKASGPKEGMAGADRQIPAPISEQLTKQVQDNALRAFKAVGASGVARVDSFVNTDTGETWVMEINTVPGSFSFYLWEASGLPFADLMDELIDIAKERAQARADLMFTFDSELLKQTPKGKARG
ncbi:MAG TPA: D-alanine--D-alanine ligase family protein [Actinomycetota bacterium]|nr:D-alanine--D-alanine ligase family protein [Actinomycetota bacterium]